MVDGRSRKRLGWAMGGVGAVLMLVAALLWQGGLPTGPAEQVAADRTPSPVAVTVTPALQITLTPQATPTSLAPVQSPLARTVQSLSPLGQPASPLAEAASSEEQVLLLPTVTAGEGGPPNGEIPDEGGPEAPIDPDEPPRAPVFGVEIVNAYPHDPEAFTQGLEFRDGELFEGTGLRGASSLRRVELETGEVLQQVDLDPQYFGEGITVFEGRIFQLTWQSFTGFVYDRETFELLETVRYPTEGWGLTHDGERLIMSDGSATITFRDPATFEPLDTIQVTDGGDLVVRLNELEYIESEIWANIWLTDRIARIDPATGVVNAWLNLGGLLDPAEQVSSDAVLNGIAYDAEGGRIFVTGKLWPYLFEIRVLDSAVAAE